MTEKDWPKLNYATGVQVGEKLIGTADGLINVLYSMELEETLQDDTDFCAGLDTTALCCDCCGWWCAADEVDGVETLICHECQQGDILE